MSLLEDFRTKLAATSTVTDVVSTRIYQDFPPEIGALPFIVFDRTAKDLERSLTGGNLLAKTTLEVICYATDPDTAEDLSDAVEAAIEGATGTWGSSTIRGAFVQNANNAYERFPRGSDLGISSVATVIEVRHVV